jgi:hypothetical protein
MAIGLDYRKARLVAGTDGGVCWNGGDIGHLARDCDEPQTGRASGPRGGRGGPGRGGGGPRSAHATPPAAGKPHIKTIEDHPCKYCARCRKWFWGPKAHLTEEHVVGAGRAHVQNAPQTPQTPQASQAEVMGSGRTAPPLDPVVVDLMTDESERAERINWSASVLHRAPARH